MVWSGVLVTPRDRAMLAWIGRHGIVTPEQLARRFFARSDGDVGMRVAYRRFAKLQSLGLLRRDATPHSRSPHVIRLTQAGAKAGEIDIAPARLVEPEIRHSLALVDLMERLTEAHPDCAARTGARDPDRPLARAVHGDAAARTRTHPRRRADPGVREAGRRRAGSHAEAHQ